MDNTSKVNLSPPRSSQGLLKKVDLKEVERTQTRTFTAWANNILKPRKMVIRNLAADLKNGEILINLFCELLNEKLPAYTKNTKKPILMAANIDTAITLLTKNGVKTGIQPIQILEGNVTSILGLMWITISNLEILGFKIKHKKHLKHSKPSRHSKTKSEKEELKIEETNVEEMQSLTIKEEPKKQTAETIMLDWVNKVTCRDTENSLVKNFKQDWKDGSLLASLIETFDEENSAINHKLKNPLSVNKNAIDVAYTVYGIPKLITPEAITQGHDSHSLMTYISVIKKEYESNFQTSKNLLIEKQKIDQAETNIILATLSSLLHDNLGVSFSKNFSKVKFSSETGCASDLGISYHQLGLLLEKLHSVNLNLNKNSEKQNKEAILSFLKNLGFKLETDRDIFKAIIMSNLKREALLVSWVNSHLKYDIPIENISEVTSSGKVFADLLHSLLPESPFKPEDFEQDDLTLLEQSINVLKSNYGINEEITAKKLKENESPLQSLLLLSKLYEETEQKKMLSNFTQYLEWVHDMLKDVYPDKETVLKYGEEWQNGNAMLNLLQKLDAEAEYSVIFSEPSSQHKWELIKEILLSRFGVMDAVKLDCLKLSTAHNFSENLLKVISFLKNNELVTDSDHDSSYLSITDSNYQQSLLDTANFLFGTKLLEPSDIKQSAFLTAYLDKVNIEYDDDLVSDFISESQRVASFIKILQDHYSLTHSIGSKRYIKHMKSLDTLSQNLSSEFKQNNLTALLKLIKSAQLHSYLQTHLANKKLDKRVSHGLEFSESNMAVIISEECSINLGSNFLPPDSILKVISAHFPGLITDDNQNNLESKIKLIRQYSETIGVKPITRNDLFSGSSNAKSNINSYLISLLHKASLTTKSHLCYKWMSSLLTNHSQFFITNTNLKQVVTTITETNQLQILKDLITIIDSSLQPSLNLTNSLQELCEQIKESFLLTTTDLKFLLIQLYERSLFGFIIRKRLKQKLLNQQLNLQQTNSTLDLLSSLASEEVEPELNKAGYNVQFTISASAKNERDASSAAHIKSTVKGPFPINLSKAYKRTKLVTSKITSITKVNQNEYKCNYIPKHQGIYMIRIFIYKKETKVSPIYFAITSKCGFWLKVTKEGKIVATDHDVLKQSDYKNKPKTNINKLKDWRKGQAAQELDFKKNKGLEVLGKELVKIRNFDKAVTEYNCLKSKKLKEERKGEYLTLTNNFKQNLLTNFLVITNFGLHANVLKKGFFATNLKQIILGAKESDKKWEIFEWDKNFEEGLKVCKLVKGESKVGTFFDKGWIKKFPEVNFNKVVRVETGGGKKVVVFEFEEEDVAEYVLRVMQVIVEDK